MEDATEEHAVRNKTKAEDVVVVVLTEEELVDHHSKEKDSVLTDPHVEVTRPVEKESVNCLPTECGHLIPETEEVKKQNMTWKVMG